MKISKTIFSLATTTALAFSAVAAMAAPSPDEVAAAGTMDFQLSAETQHIASENVGQHVRFLIVKKSKNPQNLMAFYSKLGPDCTFLRNNSNQAIFDFYWLMNGTDYKRVNSIIKGEIFKRLQQTPSDNPNKFSVKINDLSRVQNDIPSEDWKIDVVSAQAKDGSCSVKAIMKLGKASGFAPIHLKEIYSDADATITGRVTVRQLKLSGTSVKTGKPLSQTFVNSSTSRVETSKHTPTDF